MTLVVRRRPGRADVIIDRPAARNALNTVLFDEISDVLGELAADADVRVVVVSGAGDRAFCAGADLQELNGLAEAEALAWLERGHRTLAQLYDFPKPTIAALNGAAVGGGLELALACSMIVAADHARLGLPEASIGLLPGLGGTQRLTAAIGRHRALRLMLTGDLIEAPDAFALGLLSVPPVPRQSLEALVDQLAGAVIANGPMAIAAILRLTSPPELGADGIGLVAERREGAMAISSAEGREAVTAFLGRRRAGFAQ